MLMYECLGLGTLDKYPLPVDGCIHNYRPSQHMVDPPRSLLPMLSLTYNFQGSYFNESQGRTEEGLGLNKPNSRGLLGAAGNFIAGRNSTWKRTWIC